MRVVEPHEFKGLKRPKKKHGRRYGLRIFIVLIAGVYITASMLRPLPEVTPVVSDQTITDAKNVPVSWPSYGQAAVGAVGYGVLDTQGEQKALPMASVAKVMVALAVLKQKPLKVGEQGPTITITQADVDYYEKVLSEGGSNVPVIVGEGITQYQALQALLLPSSNNMAHTLAVWAYGSEKAYTTYVNNLAKTLGMNNSKFDDASGYSSKTVASSEDLAKLAVNAMDNPVIAEIVAQPDAVVPVAGRIYNVNGLLGRNGIIGIKTGNTEEAGGCFMAAAVRTIAGRRVVVVSVIMGAPTRDTALRDSVPLTRSVLDGFEETKVISAGQQVGRYDVPWGDDIQIIAKDDIKGVIWRGTPVKAQVALDTIKSGAAPQKDTQVGTIRGSFGRMQASSPALLAGTMPEPTFMWHLMPRLF